MQKGLCTVQKFKIKKQIKKEEKYVTLKWKVKYITWSLSTHIVLFEVAAENWHTHRQGYLNHHWFATDHVIILVDYINMRQLCFYSLGVHTKGAKVLNGITSDVLKDT